MMFGWLRSDFDDCERYFAVNYKEEMFSLIVAKFTVMFILHEIVIGVKTVRPHPEHYTGIYGFHHVHKILI